MTAGTPDTDTYGLKAEAVPDIAAPEISYRPPGPKNYRPRIGLIGAGGISASHLDAYRTAGWEVAAICDRTLAKASGRVREYCPGARATDDHETILNDPAIDVVDFTPHPADRLPLVEAAIGAGKHVLSQKPFVLDLDDGERLVRLADKAGVRLAVNQNGRWAPHMAWMREAIRAGLVGEVISCHVSIHWDHGWIAGTPFEQIENLILYDFGIHWFDFLASIAGARVESVFATAARAHEQRVAVPLLAQALVRLRDGQASLVFDGSVSYGPRDTIHIAGTKGSLVSDGPDLGSQTVTLTTESGRARPRLAGSWFNDGFRGAMGELLVAIEEEREPSNSARGNLDSLALAFAAIGSAGTGRATGVGEIRRIKT